MCETFLPSVDLSPPCSLIRYDVCLFDIQQCRSELLQLTAGYTHERSVQAGEAKYYVHAEE